MNRDWQRKPLEDCIERVTYTRKIRRSDFLDAGRYPIVSQEQDFINGYWNTAADVYRVTTPLVVFGDHTKVLKYVDFDFVLGADGVKLLQPREFLLPKFFYYMLQTANLGSLGYARHYRLLKDLVVAYPDRHEQTRIVAVLDEVSEGISTAKANAERNLQNARAILESHLNALFAARGNRWVDRALADTCRVFTDGDWVESKDQSPKGIRLIQTGNVGSGVFKSRAEKARYISEATFKRLHCTEIFAGDCLISRLPDPVGRSCLLPDTGERMITAVDCTIVRFETEVMLPTFFVYFSQSNSYLAAVRAATTGTTRDRISRNNLGAIKVPVAPIADQSRVVATLSALSADTDHLESIYRHKIAALEALRMSILHAALAGHLQGAL